MPDAAGLTYREVGATSGRLPDGYRHVERSRVVGRGRQAFDAAAEAVMTWGLQRGAGLGVETTAPRPAVGADVTLRLGPRCLAVRAPCRVVHVVETPSRQGFAYGTLHGHPESGEELFLLEHQPDDTVTLTVRAFSRPARWFTRLGAPGALVVQRLITERYLLALDQP